MGRKNRRNWNFPDRHLEHKGEAWYEYAVLVTGWEEKELMAVAQAYCDRADTENMFDELKNQWGMAGISTQDLKRSQLMARMVALIFNLVSLYTPIASGNKPWRSDHDQAECFYRGIPRQQTQHAK